MSYDDAADSAENPFPGQLYNRPCTGQGDCRDVRANVTVDYKGSQVTAANMLKVLQGESIDGGKKLASTENDEVFVFYVDHGGPGILGTPVPPYLYAKDLLATLQQMHDTKMFKQLTFYVEACESGSIFANLPANINIYATTAADATESSWGCYCPPNDVIKGKSINSCLGDLYSVSWMENSESGNNMQVETLEQQYQEVKTLTNRSHVRQFGDVSIDSELISKFMSAGSSGVARPRSAMQAKSSAVVDSREAGMASLLARLHAAPTAEAKAQVQTEIDAEHAARARHGAAAAAVTALLPDVSTVTAARTADLGTMSEETFDWDCYRALNTELELACKQQMTDYTFKYTRVNALACRADGRGAKGGVEAAIGAIREACASA